MNLMGLTLVLTLGATEPSAECASCRFTENAPIQVKKR